MLTVNEPPRPLNPWIPVAGAVLLLLVSVGGYAVGRARVPTLPPASSSVTVVRSTPSVVMSLRDLARLESAEAHIERVVDVRDKQSRLFGLLQTEDALLLVAAGSVVAGVDLSQLRDDAVVVDEAKRKVTITLPPAEILSTRLDNERTFVHTRSTDVLARRKESLESEARREAERSIREAAEQSGVRSRASRNAAATVESLIKSLGYEQVEVKLENRPSHD